MIVTRSSLDILGMGQQQWALFSATPRSLLLRVKKGSSGNSGKHGTLGTR